MTLPVTAALVTPAQGTAQNLYMQARNPRSLIADHRARNVGDILTITIREMQQVRNEDKIDRTNSTNLAARLEDYTLSIDTFKTNRLPKFDLKQSRQFKGEAKQEQRSSVQASIAAVVVDVQPNGNLVVVSSRQVIVDDVEKTVRISGIVRPLDISTSNMVGSEQVADARIALSSAGGNNRTVTRGPIATVFDTLLWAVWPF